MEEKGGAARLKMDQPAPEQQDQTQLTRKKEGETNVLGDL